MGFDNYEAPAQHSCNAHILAVRTNLPVPEMSNYDPESMDRMC